MMNPATRSHPVRRCLSGLLLPLLLLSAARASAQQPSGPPEAAPPSAAAQSAPAPTENPAAAPSTEPGERSPEQILREAALGYVPQPLVYPPATADQRSNWGLLFEGALLDSDNGRDFRETGGYYKLLSLLQAYTPQEVHERSAAYLSWDTAMTDPNSLRGAFVHRRGVFKGSVTVRLDRPVSGITDVWRCGMTDGDGSDRLIFDMIEPPPASLEADWTPVEIEGIFYRTVRYESEQQRWVEVPYLLVKNIRAIEKGEKRVKGALEGAGLVVLVAALLFLVFRLVSVVRQQRLRGYRSRREPSLHETIEQRAGLKKPKSPRSPPNSPPSRPPPSP